jgi:hypothetical protein
MPVAAPVIEAAEAASVGGLSRFWRAAIDTRAQSSRLAEFGGRGMSFNICRGTLGSLAMFTAIKNASSRVSSFALERGPDSFSK